MPLRRSEGRWTAQAIAQLLAAAAGRAPAGQHGDPAAVADSQAAMAGMPSRLDQLTLRDHAAFVEYAYRVLVQRPPTEEEYLHVLSGLLAGDSKAWLLGNIRYSAEGRRVGVEVPGLRVRYVAHRVFELPIVGPVLEWLHVIATLPVALRKTRAMSQVLAGSATDTDQAVRGLVASAASSDRRAAADTASDESSTAIRRRLATLETEVTTLGAELRAEYANVQYLTSKVGALFPRSLGASLEVEEESPLARGRAVARATRGTPIGAQSQDERYALFEYAFYDPLTVAQKQRVYIPYLDRLKGIPGPFLDLGCGRGEFLRIVREHGIETVGVDMSAVALGALQEEGFEVVHGDILQFLANDARTYCGASALQVVEHFDAQQVDRLLTLLAARLAVGALLILETPNPRCPFALAQFHMDPTHVAPIPPDRLRFSVEAAGFDDVTTLFQAPAPPGLVVGSDARSHYMDYAIVARRCAS